MSSIVIDELTIGSLFNQIDRLIESSRAEMNKIVSAYKSRDTYNIVSTDKNLEKTYGLTADDYSKMCYLKMGIDEAIIDVRNVRRIVTATNAGLVPSAVKSYKYKADNLIEDLLSLKEAVVSARDGLSVTVRYLSSLSYASYEKYGGAKC